MTAFNGQDSKRTEKLQLMMDEIEINIIDDWRFENRMPSRAAAIRELLRRGLSSKEFGTPPADASSGDYRVIVNPREK